MTEKFATTSKRIVKLCARHIAQNARNDVGCPAAQGSWIYRRSFYKRYIPAQILCYLQLNMVYDFSVGEYTIAHHNQD